MSFWHKIGIRSTTGARLTMMETAISVRVPSPDPDPNPNLDPSPSLNPGPTPSPNSNPSPEPNPNPVPIPTRPLDRPAVLNPNTSYPTNQSCGVANSTAPSMVDNKDNNEDDLVA
ncbi:uncharacterized protein BP5553_02447 [Venustampulla echinocandica]|uniref:Uncharacterized protein n=1 Tax=Venustampulla echinocandica TaxID=2656787 RepID=A0A370U3X5_9HELO|nr:uncharacterized protein BP5553_02447 [Venustampulla echinocandica]RDL42468.1 hypothetical protein BP5553_02447 [Venustampulla echinocandica]